MDNVASDPEFPSDQSRDELLDQFFSIPCCQQDSSNQKEDEQEFAPLYCEDGKAVKSKKSDGVSQGKRIASTGFDEKPKSENKKKNVIHRNAERQRRQEMTTLNANLRSLLPLEYLKGKRSASDQMHEAVKYIKHLQNRITELTDKRDELRRSSNLLKPISMPGSSSTECSDEDSVAVRASFVGVEVAINTGVRRALPLSKVLDVTAAEGLDVVNCTSTKVNERVLRTVESEVSNRKSIDMSELQKKLTELITHFPS